MLDALSSFVQPWADLYAEQAWLAIGVLALHLVSLFLGGGLAISADRQLIRARGAGAEPLGAVLRELHAVHPWVIGALSLTILSGAALFASDVGTFAGSVVFWIKMSLLVILLANGGLMLRAERRLLDPSAVDRHDGARGSLQFAAGVSLVSWTTLVILGVILGSV